MADLYQQLKQCILEEGLLGIPQVWTKQEVPGVPLSGGQTWEELRQQALTCKRCRLCEGRTSVVFGTGWLDAPRIAFIGEGPGAEEDRLGEPFVGKAGELLTQAIVKGMGLRREDVFIGNVVKCRPPDNRTPLPDEIATCQEYLFKQLELIAPEVIVCLGAVATQVVGKTSASITKIRGTWHEWNGIPVMPTFHPAYLLRNPAAKRDFWEDLKQVMKKLGIELRS